MGNGGNFLRLSSALLLSALLAGCGSVGETIGSSDVSLGDTPAVSGNTFDRYNDFAVIPPHSENLSISYRYELESPPRGETVAGIAGPVWLYAERSAAAPESFFQISLVSGDAESSADSADGPIVETVRLGSIRYKSVLYCLDPSAQDLPPPVAGFIRNVAVHGHGLSQALFVRHYEGEHPGLDGKWLSMAYILDITRTGYDCAAIGDPASPEAAYLDAVNHFKDLSSRAFEVVR